ncbi:MAG: RNA polymerase factor sigma-54 [Alphaproteobacteria bacterium]|nr:RNA polymerase factor sigma-54 [Alphaproteobacteria bacterium]
MAITPRLELKLSQTLVMTPQLQQAIKLLQLSSLELASYVETELEQNPLLELDERENDNQREADREQATPTDAAEGGEQGDIPDGPDTAELTGAETMPSDGESPLDADYGNVYEQDGVVDVSGEAPAAFADVGGNRGRGGNAFDDERDFESALTKEITLRDYLTEQLNVDIEDPVERMIGVHLIDLLDESGWLSGDVETIAETLNCELSRVESVLDLMQHFDPPGIFARDLRECLALQLREKDRLDPAMAALLDNLELLARQDIKSILKVCGVDADDLADMVNEIRALNPKPAQTFDHEVAQTIIPDILMRANPDGGWIVELNPDTLPRVLVNTTYYAEVNQTAQSKQDKEYLAERFQSASWLVKSLDQRANTILKVASELVRQQHSFFVRGVEHLRPLVLRDIAEVIEMHESTVSRVTTNKYMSTPRGLFELKYFFTSSIASASGGDAHSAESVRHRIKALIDEETLDSVFSDDRIVEILRDSGIDIARRTVAKYRETLKIPSSIQRKRQKAQAL